MFRVLCCNSWAFGHERPAVCRARVRPWLGADSVGAAAADGAGLARRGGFCYARLAAVLLHHAVGAVIFSYMLLRSTVVTLRQGGIVWRDTFYPLDELRRGAV